jgi:hypothetical protein
MGFLQSAIAEHSNHLPQLNEVRTPERLGENISQLLFGSNMINIHFALLDAFSDEMESSVNMLAPTMMYGVLAKCNR